MDQEERLAGAQQSETDRPDPQLAAARPAGLGRIALRKILREHAGPATILALAYFLVLLNVWAPGVPAGADTWGHLARAEYLADVMQQQGTGAYFTTAWMPNWYLGDPFRTYYPPLTTNLLAPLVALAGSGAAGLKLLLSGLYGCLGLAAYLAVFSQMGPWQAGVGSALVMLAPYQARTVFFEGNLPRGLSLLALPLLFVGTEQLLTGRGRRVPWMGGLALGWAWAVLAHPQQAYMFGIGFTIYVVLRLFLTPDVELQRGLNWIGAAVAGVLLTAPWSLPAYSRGELQNVPFLPIEKVSIFSAPLAAALPQLNMADGTIASGIGVLAVAVLATASRPDPRRNALLIAALITFVLALGPAGVLFSLLPLNQQLLPERFLNFTSFALAISAAGIVPFRRNWRLLRAVIVVLFLAIDLVPSLNLYQSRQLADEDIHLREAIASADLEASQRWLLFTQPEPDASQVYAAGSVAPLVNGWALENTPHHLALRRYLQAAEWSGDYLLGLMNRWSVQGAVLSGTEPRATADLLESSGWGAERLNQSYTAWLAPSAVSPVQRIPERRMLVLGDRLAPFLMAYPFAEEAEAIRLSEFPQDRLLDYAAVGLFQFESTNANLGQIAEGLEAYVQNGGRLILDLSGMEAEFGRGVDLLGVNALRLSFANPMAVRWHGDLAGLTEQLQLPGEAQSWSGATYQGLDGVLAEVRLGDEWRPVLGYRDIGRGRVWFVGLNLLFYAQSTGDAALAGAIRDVTLQEVAVARSISLDPIQVSDWQADGQGLSFAYSADSSVPEALVSYTYSPRFRALVDDRPVPLASYEHLIKIELSSGDHRVAIDYDPFGTGYPALGWAVGILALLGLIGAEIYERRTFIPPMAEPEEAPLVSDVTHGPCANCGFLLSEISPPTAETFPFQVVHCPICGLRMDAQGFDPGESLDDVDRDQRLAAFLEAHNYDPDTVHKRWGFEPESFFSGEGELPDLPDTSNAAQGEQPADDQ